MAVTTWTFTDNFEGWTFSDGSTGSGTATRSHVSGAIRNHLAFLVNPPTSRSGRGNNSFSNLDVQIENGDTIAADISAVTGFTGSASIVIKATYTDETFEQVAVDPVPGATTLTLTLTQNKILDTILVSLATGSVSPSPAQTQTRDILEVRLTTATTPPPIAGTGEKPLEMDIDVENGAKRWVTIFDAATLKLKEYDSSLAEQTSFTFMSSGCNITSIDVREFYISPHAPAFYGTASLEDIIYVYGRWDDGSIQHIHKSTDGASSFSDIGDSATWGEGWVGAFLAVDANTLYAFVNGDSRALYRTTDGGTTWTSLSSLPFDVDPGGASGHPDGRILISNRDAGGQTAAYAEGPDYSSWIDATGAPSFPTSTPGNGSNAIIWIV